MTRVPAPVFQSAYVSERINTLMAGLLPMLDSCAELRRGLIKAEFLSNSDDEGLVCLSYSRRLDDYFLNDILTPLPKQLGAAGVIARARRQRLVAGSDHLVQWHQVNGCRYPQILLENSFSQHNLDVCSRMLQWVAERTCPEQRSSPFGRDLLELCCGNGNFTLPLSVNFRRVLATERDQRAVASARLCARQAGVQNLKILRMTSEEMVAAWRGDRPFRRLRAADVDLASYDFSTLLVNPPRAGLEPAVLPLVESVDSFVYVSCSPRKLAKDLNKITSHFVTDAALFDQFPFTSHAEVAVRMQRKA